LKKIKKKNKKNTMYLYIYDSFLNDKKYNDLLIKIEKRVTDLGIKGRVVRLSVLKNMKELIIDGIKDGVETIIVTGDTKTFSKVINITANLNITLGLIPVNSNNKIAKMLGIPPGVLACEILSSRIIKRIDLGKANKYYFINKAYINNGIVEIDYGNFKIMPITKENNITFYNFSSNKKFNPTDGILETVITPIKSTFFGKKLIKSTIFPFDNIKINSLSDEQATLLIDEQIIVKTPIKINVIPKKLKIIVGSERNF